MADRTRRIFEARGLVFSCLAVTLLLPQTAACAALDEAAGRNIHALQFGLFFGGSATQYDRCVEQGRLEGGSRTAEEMAASYLKSAAPFAGDARAMDDVNKGWDIARQKVAEQDATYWERRCHEIDGQWKKYVDTLKLQ